MRDLEAITDRVEIEALRAEFTDAGMMRDYDRFASLFTEDAVWRIPVVGVEFAGREQIRAGIERLVGGLWDYLLQAASPGPIELEGDTASGRAYVLSFGNTRDGGSHLNYSVYHDRYRRTSQGWKFAERADEVKYLDTTPLAGSPPHQAHASTAGP
jgi:ketosteroid isomerase-like protein